MAMEVMVEMEAAEVTAEAVETAATEEMVETEAVEVMVEVVTMVVMATMETMAAAATMVATTVEMEEAQASLPLLWAAVRDLRLAWLLESSALPGSLLSCCEQLIYFIMRSLKQYASSRARSDERVRLFVCIPFVYISGYFGREYGWC